MEVNVGLAFPSRNRQNRTQLCVFGTQTSQNEVNSGIKNLHFRQPKYSGNAMPISILLIRSACLGLLISIVALCAIGHTQVDDLKLTELIDLIVDVRVNNNLQYSECKIIKAAEGKTPGSIKNLRIQLKGTRKSRSIPIKKVVEIYLDGQPLDVAYDRDISALVRSDKKKQKRLDWEKKTNARLAGVRAQLWKPLQASEHDEFMQRHRAFIQKTRETLTNVKFRLVETEYFLFLTNLESQEVDGLIIYLDAMYEELCIAFGIPPTQNVWCGKCVVIAFRSERDFLNFENALMNRRAEGAQGICHSFGDGRVVFAGFQGSNGFPNVIVHETSHGFLHRYISSARIPSWLNEGIADWIGNEIVKSQRVPKRQQRAAEQVAAQGSLGDFFTAQPIRAEQYGIASAMVEILLRADGRKGKFKDFLDGIKQGEDPEQSLKESFGLTYLELGLLYAKAIGLDQ